MTRIALIVQHHAHVVQDDAFVADLDDAALDLDLRAHVTQAKVDGAQIESAADVGLVQRAAHQRAHVRLAFRVRHGVGRDEREQARADVALDVGLDVLGHEPRAQLGAPAEAHRRAVDGDGEVLDGNALFVQREAAGADDHVAIEVLGAQADGAGDRHLAAQLGLVHRSAGLELDAQVAGQALQRAGGAQERLHQLQVQVPGQHAGDALAVHAPLDDQVAALGLQVGLVEHDAVAAHADV